MLIRKEIIRPGDYTYIDPDTGLPARLLVTADTVRHYHDQGNKMLKLGVSVPVPLEHQPDAVPQTAAERAAHELKHNAGFTKRYQIGTVDETGPDGKRQRIGNVLFGVLDVHDPEIFKKLPTTIRYTSPWINSFTDGDGRKWDGVISHVALTTRPRIARQQPFAANMAAALSMLGAMTPRPFAAPRAGGGGIQLSRAGLLITRGGKTRPACPVAFSLFSGVKLAEEDLEAALEDTEPEEKVKVDVEEESDSPLDNVDTQPDAKDVSIHETIGHLLKALGFSPPEGMDETTFERDIYETLMAKVQEMGAKANTPEEPPMEDISAGGGGEDQNPIVQEAPQMFASLAEVEKIKDPERRKMAKAMFSMQENLKAATGQILAGAKKTRDQRIERLAKRLPAKQRDVLLAMAARSSARLALSADGTVVDPMQESLDLLEHASMDMPTLLKDPSAYDVQPHPSDPGVLTEERRQQIVGEWEKNAGIAARTPAAQN